MKSADSSGQAAAVRSAAKPVGWEPMGVGSLGIDWNHDRGKSLNRCDPYLVWQDAIASTGSEDDGAFGRVREICVLIEKHRKGDALEDLLRDDVHLNHGHQTYQTTFLTVYMAVAPEPLRRLIEAVASNGIKCLTLQTERPLARRDNGQGGERSGSPPLPAAHAEPLKRFGSTPVIGVIDDACPFTHAAFWDGAHPRLTALWQQDGELQAPSGESPGGKSAGSAVVASGSDDVWAPVRRRAAGRSLPSFKDDPVGQEVVLFAHGRELAVDRVAKLRLNNGERELRQLVDRDGPNTRFPDAGPTAGEMAEQRQVAAPVGGQAVRPPARPLPRASHGSHVMSLAAAQPNPLSLRHLADKPARPLPVAFVQLPQRVVDDTSSRSLAAHALDGIHYLLDHAGNNPLIVNLSYGTYAGPHDGRSMFERALVELLELNKNLHVVLPAGNSHLRQSHVHARLEGNAAASTQRQRTVYWRLLPDDPTDSYLEIWFPPNAEAAIHVKPPGCSSPFRLDAGEARLLTQDDGRMVFGGIYARTVAQSDHGTMALIAASPTRRLARQTLGAAAPRCKLGSLQRFRDESLAPHGTWEVTVENLGVDALDFDAWIERDDAAPYMRARTLRNAGRQSYFIDRPPGSVSPEGTLNGIATATHERLHVVGAMRRGSSLRGGGGPTAVRRLSDYSSAGPNRGNAERGHGPDAVAPADDTRRLPGLPGGGLLSGARQRMNGTSVAAAVYTRALAESLASGTKLDASLELSLDAIDRRRSRRGHCDSPRRASPALRGVKRGLRP